MKGKKLTKRQLQAIDTKNKIYNVAIDLMERKGFDNITIEEIAKKAGVSIGSFYHYFNSKNDILVEIYKIGDEFFQNVRDGFKGQTPLEKVVEFFNYYATLNVSTGIDTAKQLYTANNKMFIKKGRYMQALLTEIISEGQKSGEIITTKPASDITEFLFIAARGLVYDWCLHEGSYDLENSMTQYITRLLPTIQKF